MMLLLTIMAIVPLVNAQQTDGTSNTQTPEPQPSLLSLTNCQYLKNISDVQIMNHHQYEVLELCLYYYLAGEAQRKTTNFVGVQALAAFPPSNDKQLVRVRLAVHQVTLQHFVLNEYLRDLNLIGYMDMSWVDDRLSWSENEWKLRKFDVHSISHIWVPILAAQSFDTAMRNGDSMEVRRLQVNSNGTVRTTVNFSLRTFCDDSDFQNFPDDVYKCCYQFEPHLNRDAIEFATSGLPVHVDPKYFRDHGWYVSGTIPSAQISASTQTSQLGFCINLQRSTNSLRIELSLPSTVTAILFLLTPLLGRIHLQVVAKMAILLLQFITMQLFSARIMPHLGSAAATPKILRFLEFSISINTISICISTFLWMCSKVRRNLPPWGWLMRISEMINRCFCVFNSIDLSSGPETDSNMEKGVTGSKYQSDWTNAFVAIHSVACCGISFIYIVGYLILS